MVGSKDPRRLCGRVEEKRVGEKLVVATKRTGARAASVGVGRGGERGSRACCRFVVWEESDEAERVVWVFSGRRAASQSGRAWVVWEERGEAERGVVACLVGERS